MNEKKKYFYLSAGLLGNVLEYHDKALFSLLVPFIGPSFFPETDPITALIQTYGILFLGMLARPFGGIFFGFIADKKGRAKVLSLTISGMGIATFGMGCIPTYDQAGIFAPILLALLRGLQNFFAAGEIAASSVFVIEHSSSRLKSFTSSLVDMSTTIGILAASLELAGLGALGVLTDCWRVLFWISGALGLIGWGFRGKLLEPEEFLQAPRFIVSSVKDLISNFKPTLAIILACAFSCTTYVMSITFMNSFLTLVSPLTFRELANLNMLLLSIDAALLPFFGWLSIRWGAEKIMLCSALLTALSAIPLFYLLGDASWGIIFLVRLIIVTLGVAFASCFRSWAQALITPRKRCTLLSFGTSVAHLLVEGPITLISLSLFDTTHWLIIPGGFLAMTAVGAASAIYCMKKVKEVPAILSQASLTTG